MKKKLSTILIIVLICIVFSVIIIVKPNSDNKEITNNKNDTTLSYESTNEFLEDSTGQTINFMPDMVSCVVHAPKHSEVFLGDQRVPYVESVKYYRLFTQATGKYTLTVSKYGCHTETKEIDFSGQNSAEIYVDLKLTEEYKEEVKQVAHDNLLKIIEVCADESGDLSGLNFYNEEDKIKVQSTVDKVINDLMVDEGDYTTEKLNVLGLVFEDIISDDILYWSNDIGGTAVKFTLDYNYAWEFNGENYQDSGIDSNIQHPFIKMDYIDGEWYIRDVYLYMRKNIH